MVNGSNFKRDVHKIAKAAIYLDLPKSRAHWTQWDLLLIDTHGTGLKMGHKRLWLQFRAPLKLVQAIRHVSANAGVSWLGWGMFASARAKGGRWRKGQNGGREKAWAEEGRPGAILDQEGWDWWQQCAPNPNPHSHAWQPYIGCSNLCQQNCWFRSEQFHRSGWGLTQGKGKIFPSPDLIYGLHLTCTWYSIG